MTASIIGYRLSGQDNDSTMFDGVSPNATCPKCGCLLDFEVINPLFDLKVRKFDFSYTYDGHCIVSEKFKRFCDNSGYNNLCFRGFAKTPAFYDFTIRRVVEFDWESRKTRRERYCDLCKRYESVAGADPVFLRNDDCCLDDEFYGTDIFFGSGNQKHRLIIIGPGVYEALNDQSFCGIHYKPIFKGGLGP